MTAHGSPDGVSLDALLAHRDWVRALARRLVLDENDADDVEQETWRMAVERPPRHAESLRAWLAAVVRNAARGAGRRRSRRLRHEAATPARREVPSPEDLVAAAELQTRLARAVLELDEPYRSTVLYRFHEGLEASEIAARLGVPVETVRTRVKRAIERLRERMGVELGDDRDAWALLVLGVRESVGKVPQSVPTLSSAAAGGGLAMATGTKLVAAAVVLVAGAAWWFAPKGDDAKSAVASAPVAPADATGAASTKRAPRTRAPSDADSATTTAVAPSAAPKETPLGPDVVHGRVLDDDTGAPVAKVTVSLVWEFVSLTGKEPSAVTADDGTFRVPGAKDGYFGELLLRCDGYAECLVELPWRTGKLAKNDAGDVRIYRGKRIAGRVLAADGVTPVAGASVRLSTIGGMGGPMWVSYSVERGTSDDRGTFALERVPPSHGYVPYTVFALSKDGLGWTKLAGDAGRVDTAGIDVVLRPTGAATVTVRDESGAPRAGVQVVASPRFEPLGPKPDWDVTHDVYITDKTITSLFVATTDAQGIARLASLTAVDERTVYEFIASVTGAGQRVWKSATVRAREVATVDIVVGEPKRRAVVGVIHGTDGAPVAAAKVRSGHVQTPVATGADGRFRLEWSGEGWGEQDWIEVTAAGFANVERSIKADVKKDVLEVDIAMKPSAPIAGRVVDQDGKPVAGATLSTPRDDASINGRQVTTDDAGRFAFADTAAGECWVTLQPPPPDDEWESMPLQIVHGGDKDVVLVQRRAAAGKARLVVTVVDENGAPLAPDQVWFNAQEEGAPVVYATHGKMELGSGRVVVERMKPGHWRMSLQFPDRLGTIVPLDVDDGQTEVAVRVVVGRPGVLRGRVDAGDTGAPLPHMVMPERPDDWALQDWARPHGPKMVGAARVAADGTFEFPDVMPGRWRVWAQENGWVGEGFVDVPAGGEGTCVVTLTRAGTVTFQLAGQPPSAAVECWVGRESEPMRRRASGNVAPGKLPRLECALVPGRWRWRVSFPVAGSWGTAHVAAETQEGEVTVAAGETVVVNVAVVAK